MSAATRMRVWRGLALAGILCLGLGERVLAISVSPLLLILDTRTRTGTFTLYNDNPLPEEVEVTFGFGYPVSDSTGHVTVALTDTAATGEPSAVGWLRAFPRRLVLQPGQQQVVRVFAQIPASLPDGEYWARVLIAAKGGRPPVEQELRPDVKVAVSLKTVFAPALLLRKGRVTTGIAVSAAKAGMVGDSAGLTIDLQRTGTGAFLGRITVALVDPAGRTQAETSEPIAVYRSLRRVLALKPEGQPVARGSSLRYTLDTQRVDLGQGVLRAETVTRTVPLP